MSWIQRVMSPLASLAHAARRPTTYTGHAREVASTILTASVWPTGLGTTAVGDVTSGSEGSQVDTPVLLVHGYGANKSNWIFVRRALHQAGFARIDALNYNPFGTDIARLAERCAERVEELKDHFGVERVHLVGHSLGGLVARYAVQVVGVDGVDVCATVASPHGGVRLARYCSPLSFVSPLRSGLELRPDSPVMTLLRSSARPMRTRFVAYYSNLDMLVAARRAMILEPELDATNILVKDHGHVSIMLSRRLASSIVDQLAATEGLPGYGSPVRSLRAPVRGVADRTGERATGGLAASAQ